jgi:hypothetical protein
MTTERPVQFHYLVVLRTGQEYYFWAENEEHAREQAESAESGDPIVWIGECLHECPELAQDDWTQETEDFAVDRGISYREY